MYLKCNWYCCKYKWLRTRINTRHFKDPSTSTDKMYLNTSTHRYLTPTSSPILVNIPLACSLLDEHIKAAVIVCEIMPRQCCVDGNTKYSGINLVVCQLSLECTPKWKHQVDMVINTHNKIKKPLHGIPCTLKPIFGINCNLLKYTALVVEDKWQLL